MAVEVNRREFLLGLVSVGLLPGGMDVSEASQPDHVDRAWNRLREEPTEFEVDEDGTITSPTEDTAVNRWDIYDLTARDFSTAGDVSAIADLHQPVVWAVDRFYSDLKDQLTSEDYDYIDELVDTLRTKAEDIGGDFLHQPVSSLSSRPISRWRLHEWPSEIDGGAAVDRLLPLLSRDDFSKLQEHLIKWASGEPDWSAESDYFVNPPDGQGQAFHFFSRYVDQKVLDALRIRIVEGEHPGSTYYAAQLRASPEVVTKLAEDAGIPLRFVRAR